MHFAPVLRKKNDPRSHIPFHSLSPGKVEEISELQYHLIWSKVNSYLPVFFFFSPFYKKTKTNKSTVFDERRWHCWEMCLRLIRKGESLKWQPPNFISVLEFRKTFLSKNRNTFFLNWQLFISIKEKPQWPIIMKVYSLHNLVTGLLIFRGHINIYWRHNKYLFHFIKNCMETADRGWLSLIWLWIW